MPCKKEYTFLNLRFLYFVTQELFGKDVMDKVPVKREPG